VVVVVGLQNADGESGAKERGDEEAKLDPSNRDVSLR
jgi:hypothetical protein